MKKSLVATGLLMGSLAFAQSFGVKGGLNIASVSKDSGLFSDTKSKVGFNAGIFANLPISEDFSIQPEILYNSVGTKSVYKGVNIEQKTKLDYINIPVMVQYNATPNLYLEAGPEFGFLVNYENKFDSGILTSLANYALKKENLNTFNFSLGIGAGYYFTPNIGLTARYTAGLTNIGKENKVYSSSKNNVFQVGLAYKFK